MTEAYVLIAEHRETGEVVVVGPFHSKGDAKRVVDRVRRAHKNVRRVELVHPEDADMRELG